MDMVYWYYTPGQQVYPQGLKFWMHHDIRKALYWCVYPPVITDEDLAWTGVQVVYATQPPADVPEGMIAVDGTPELVDGVWMQRWDVVPEPVPEPEPEPEESAPVEPPPVDEPETTAP